MNGMVEEVTKKNISMLNGHQESPLTNGDGLTEEIEMMKFNNKNYSEKIMPKTDISEPKMSLIENEFQNPEQSERTLTNGFHCDIGDEDDDDDDSCNELHKTSSEKTLSSKSTCSDQYNPAIDSSTDTLIDDETKDLSRMGSKTSLDNDSSLASKEGSDTKTSSEKSFLDRVQSLEASSSISTSTSDISDSHISPDSKARKVLGRELKLQCLLAQSVALRNGCSKSVGGMNSSLPSTPQNPTPSSARTTPNSTCPPTPGTDAGKVSSSLVISYELHKEMTSNN